MGTRTREDRRLRLLSAACLALPESERTDCGAHADFRVRGRIFAYFLKNHGGDGITAACFKSRLGEHVEHVKRAPDRFYLPQYIGRRGWFGIRLDRQNVDWDEVIALATISYHLVAAKGQRRPPAAAAAPTPLANVVTSQSLVRGTPPSVISVGLNARRMTEEQRESDRMLRSAAPPGAAPVRRSAGLRGRR
jgi:predicted DNA-binding protein (MmcQ/YjbR family)